MKVFHIIFSILLLHLFLLLFCLKRIERRAVKIRYPVLLKSEGTTRSIDRMYSAEKKNKKKRNEQETEIKKIDSEVASKLCDDKRMAIFTVSSDKMFFATERRSIRKYGKEENIYERGRKKKKVSNFAHSFFFLFHPSLSLSLFSFSLCILLSSFFPSHIQYMVKQYQRSFRL